MSKSFGLDFVLINDVRQRLNPKIFAGGPWLHLATVKRGLKEYMAFKKINEKFVYIEELDLTSPHLLKQIEDDNEYNELMQFLLERGCLTISGKNKEIKMEKRYSG